MRDKRVGNMLVAAVVETTRMISITEVAVQAARQGLEPRDFDRLGGEDALIAIAVGLRPTGTQEREPLAWRGAVAHALKLVSAGGWTWRQRRGDNWRAQVRARRFMKQEAAAPHLGLQPSPSGSAASPASASRSKS